MKRLSEYVQGVLRRRFRESDKEKRTHAIIALAETAIPLDVEDYIDSDKYPDIGLHEEEKEAIRRFVGSSMLNTSDILDWDQFCRTTWDQRSASGAPGVRPAHGEPDCEDGTTASKGRRLGDGNRKGSEAGSCQAGRAPS